MLSCWEMFGANLLVNFIISIQFISSLIYMWHLKDWRLVCMGIMNLQIGENKLERLKSGIFFLMIIHYFLLEECMEKENIS